MMLEYEHDFDNPMPYLIQSVNEINRLCEELIKANDEKARTGDTILLPAYKARISPEMTMQGKVPKPPSTVGTIRPNPYHGPLLSCRDTIKC